MFLQALRKSVVASTVINSVVPLRIFWTVGVIVFILNTPCL